MAIAALAASAPRRRRPSNGEEALDFDSDAGRLERERAGADDARLDPAVVIPGMVDDATVSHLHDEVVPNRDQFEVVIELRAGVDRLRRRRSHLDDDHGIVELHRRAVDRRPASYERVGLIDRASIDPNGQAVGVGAASHASSPYRVAQSEIDVALDLRMLDALRRHCDDFAADELVSLRLAYRPGDELVGVHAQLGDGGHGRNSGRAAEETPKQETPQGACGVPE